MATAIRELSVSCVYTNQLSIPSNVTLDIEVKACVKCLWFNLRNPSKPHDFTQSSFWM